METKYKRLKYACYTTSMSMSVVANISPILFVTFRNVYHISYSLLGLLILINFVSQLMIDLIFSFFSSKFNIPKVILVNPILAVIGLLIYTLYPLIFPQTAYIGLVIGTLFFSASSGLTEVLISPIIASIPAKDPEREMSKLHSVYAWGCVFVVIFSTLFLLIFGTENWNWLIFILALIPLTAFLLYLKAEIPNMTSPNAESITLKFMKNKTLWLCFFIIFFAGASELCMGQWSSGFLEQSLHIPKIWGDLFGVALFSVMLGIGRSLYAKIGKNITRVLLFGIIGATLCYLIVAVSNSPFVCMIACALTGLCVSMLWPGSLIVSADLFPTGGVFIYAMMATGGDLGASVAPQLVGIVTDFVMANPTAIQLAQTLHLSAEQLGMKCGMLVGMMFPLVAIPLYIYMYKKHK